MSDLIDRQSAIDAVAFGITYAKVFDKETGKVKVKELFAEGNYELKNAIDRIKELPSVDVVGRSAYNQVRWERDTAIAQLSQIGKGLGEKMDDVVKVVRCNDCKYYNPIGVCNETSWAVCEDSFCSFAERK